MFNLVSSTMYSKLDAEKEFWPLHLHHEGWLSTIFNTHLALRFMRMPFGLKMSQDVFKMCMDQILKRCSWDIDIHENISMYSKSEEGHDQNLLNFMRVDSYNRLVLSSRKCEIKCKLISLYVIFTNEEMKPDPAKIQGITDLPLPEEVTQLKFCKPINFMQPLIPHLSHNTAPLRPLLKQKSIFVKGLNKNRHSRSWSLNFFFSFQDHYYDRSKPVAMQVSASKSLTITHTWYDS